METSPRRSIVNIISLTLGLVGASGCVGGDDTADTGPNTTTDPSSGESGMDASSTSTTDEPQTSEVTTDDPTDELPPCPEPIETPFEVADWAVSAETYATMPALAEQHLNWVWDTLDEVSRCHVVCAYASGLFDLIENSPGYYDIHMNLDVCELTIPMMDVDGVLDCSGDHVMEEVCLGGRMPLEWVPAAPGGPALAARLDAMATMEAVSITAFEELAAQLERLGSPAALVDRCRAAADDERRHLELLELLGGHGPSQLPSPAPASTSVFEIALHNAVEGCVHETWAALLARHQAEHATQAETRQVFAEIADDEARHAQLAWDLHTWLCGLLSTEEVARVEAARAEALDELERIAVRQALAVSTPARVALGLPEPARAAALARVFSPQLAAAA